MSDTAAPLAATPTFLQKHHFLLRRLHSLSGIVPVGVFVMMHLFTNFQLMVGDYQHEVEFIHSLPALFIIEVTLWGSIGFHAALGLVYTFTGKANVDRYAYQDNWRYTLQRITGILALIFIFLHIATLRWRWGFFGWFTPFFVAGPDGTPLVSATTANALQHSKLVLILYIVGVASVVYHWCNGLWTAAISWGLTITVAAQKRWGYVCATLGLVLAIFSAGSIVGAMTYKVSDAERAAMQAAIERHEQGLAPIEKSSEH
ncbi:MAG: hypothetical protein K8S99_15750 [Planctomycetes bacterium]|nr:hypothetical protein [Planctomycetota bacterium]